MKMATRLAAACIIILSAGVVGADPGVAQEFTMPVFTAGPELKGDLSSPMWEKAVKLSGFVAANHLTGPHAPTEVLTLCDAENLYVGFIAHEPRMDRLITDTSGHDGPVYTDDCVEVTLDVTAGGVSLYHWIVNSNGIIWDGLHCPARTGHKFTAGATARCSRLADRWICELKVPFAALPTKPQPGEVWGINFCRERRAGETVEFTSWHPAASGFSEPENTGRMLFASGARDVSVHVTSRGGVSADANEDGLNVFAVSIQNRSGQAATVHATVATPDGKAATADVVVPAGKQSELRVPYTVPYPGCPDIAFSVSVDGRGVYAGTLQALEATDRGPRSWVVADPLFDGLLTDGSPGLRSQGILIWGHFNDVSLLRETAKRFAARYVEDEVYKLHGELGLRLIGHGVWQEIPDNPWGRRHVTNVPVARQQHPDAPWVLDPRSIEQYLSYYDETLSKPHPLVWGIFAGDEVYTHALQQGAKLMAHPGDYDYIREADEEVRRDFGGGKWGIPAGIRERDPNPYKWIAFRRWVNAKLLERHRKLEEIVRRYEPDMPIVSVDAGGGVNPFEWSTMAGCFDIFTQQAGPRRSQWRASIGCTSKLVADLTGKEFWPCAHIENYGMDTTPQECVEELSQVFRNGGSGLHLFLPDLANAHKLVGDTKTPYFGSPRRWHTIFNIVKLIKEMPPPRRSGYERTAVLVNDDTLQSVPLDAERPYGENTEACYTLLGPVARSWFKFIDCAQVLEAEDLGKRFDIIYLPAARYQRPEIVAKLTGFVEQGGTLICMDPQAFETDLLGNDTTASRTKLFGVTVGDAREVKGFARSAARGPDLPLHGPAYGLTPGPDTKTVTTYDDGSPAMTWHEQGKGRAILFGSNPLLFATVEDEAWRDFFTSWVSAWGAPTGLDIWRFRFPDSVIWKEPERPGYCLTNNFVLWQEEKPRYPQNRDVGATYSYSHVPDAVPDTLIPTGSVRCSDGHLTDRRKGIMARKVRPGRSAPYELPASHWMVGWEDTERCSITFDLQEPWTPLELGLWFCGTMPEVTVEGSRDGEKWHPLGKALGEYAGEDVFDMVIALAQESACRYVRIWFAEREVGQKLSLVEVEIWGDEAEK